MTQFRTDIGTSNKGTFVRVVHEPTGKERMTLATDGCTLQALATKLQAEIEYELETGQNAAPIHAVSSPK